MIITTILIIIFLLILIRLIINDMSIKIASIIYNKDEKELKDLMKKK